MDFSASTVAAPAAPRPVTDMRPAADAAATARITKPALAVAMPTPPANSQVAEVSRSMLRADTGAEGDVGDRIAPVTMIERTLKPYGISMLPKSAEEAAKDAQADRDSRPALLAATTNNAKAVLQPA
jgi:hypothetical protein